MSYGHDSRLIHEALRDHGFARSSYRVQTIPTRWVATREPAYAKGNVLSGRHITVRAAELAPRLALPAFHVVVQWLDLRPIIVTFKDYGTHAPKTSHVPPHTLIERES
ncbi:hypothetical protein [Nonomuraea sp. NPDC023979]|uniref:hypothetical protein n=1 Tax=Nonomuraea sp. NPDC023979 TaxID=3154796 RepID=UPI00340535C5